MANYRAYAQFTANKIGKTGLSDVSIVAYDGLTGNSITTSGNATHLGKGVYQYTIQSATEVEPVGVFVTANTTVDQQEVPFLVTKEIVHGSQTGEYTTALTAIQGMLSSDPLPVRIDGIVGSTITATRGNDWMIPIDGLTLDGKIQLAIKRNDNQPDDRSALFVDSVTGLITLNGKPATDPTLASLTYSGGILTLSVDASITAQLSAVSYRYGIQSVGGTVSEKYGGEFVVNADVVRATE